MLPMYLPLLALISSLLLIKNKRNIFINNLSIFGYCFILLLFIEIILKYTGINKFLNYIFFFDTFNIINIKLLFLKLKFSNEKYIIQMNNILFRYLINGFLKISLR